MKHLCNINDQRNIEISHSGNLFRSLLEHSIPIAYACDGEGICGQCWLWITPQQHTSKESPLEHRVKKANAIPTKARLSCLVRVLGAIKIKAPYW